MRTCLFLAAWIGVLSIPYLLLDRLADTATAFAHSLQLLAVDRWFGIPSSLYGVLSGPVWTGVYEYPHFALLVGLVPALYVFRPSRAWCAFWQVTILFLFCDLVWLVWPSAPPWMLFHVGAMPVRSGVAQFASFPSFHVVVAALAARYGGRVGGVYAVCMIVVVVLTGNHYVIDCVAGWLLEIVSYNLVGWCMCWYECARPARRATLAARRWAPSWRSLWLG